MRVALTMAVGAAAIALIPDDEFDPAALHFGDTAVLSWHREDAHLLDPRVDAHPLDHPQSGAPP